MAFPTVASSVMRAVGPERSGVAFGVSNTLRQVGAVLGIAVCTAVFTRAGSYASPEAFLDGFTPAVITLGSLVLTGTVAVELSFTALRRRDRARPALAAPQD